MGLQPLRGALEAWRPGLSRAADPLQAIVAAWPGIVGANVASHSGPVAISGTTLLVATRSSAWSQQLHFLSPPILSGVRALGGPPIERIAFRTGAFRPARGRDGAAAGPGRVARKRARPQVSPAEPAADLPAAFERLRRRIGAVRTAATRDCADCHAPLERSADDLCAPCRGAREAARAVGVERLIYMAPWLTLDEVRGVIPGVGAGDFERARRHLLQRWWLVLERARRGRGARVSRLERQVASSYVLLQSRLPPDRVTPAVVRNLLGAELEALLWPHDPAK